MKKEIWKEIEEYNGDYLISNHGRVKSFKGKSKEGKILKQNSDKDGYKYLMLCKNNIKKTFRIHKLVIESFRANPDPIKYICANHIDENKQNNHIENLEWCTLQYNSEYSLSKKYKIQFPDDHIEIIFNLAKFCRENNLNRRHVYNSFNIGYFHKGYRLLEIINDSDNILKTKIIYRKSYKIQFPDNHTEIIFNVKKFCRENNLHPEEMHRTFSKNNFHKGYKILEKTNKDGIVTKL